MSLAAEILSLLREAASPDVRAEKACERVWSLKYPPLLARQAHSRRTHVDAVKVRLFETVARTGTAIIHHPDSPSEEALPGEWLAAQEPNAWHVPRYVALDNEAVEYWLFTLGNWSLQAPNRATRRRPDFARATTDSALAWLDAERIQVVIDSFHDDVSWTVVLASVLPAA